MLPRVREALIGFALTRAGAGLARASARFTRTRTGFARTARCALSSASRAGEHRCGGGDKPAERNSGTQGEHGGFELHCGYPFSVGRLRTIRMPL